MFISGEISGILLTQVTKSLGLEIYGSIIVGVHGRRANAETFNAQYMRTPDSDLEQFYLRRVISRVFISFASLSCPTFEAGWGLRYIKWDSPSACCHSRKFRGYIEWAWGCWGSLTSSTLRILPERSCSYKSYTRLPVGILQRVSG